MSDPYDPDNTSRPQRGLGRGLSALLGETQQSDEETLGRARNQRQLSIERMRPGKYQPRRNFNDDEMRSLVESVRHQGILQPILVRPVKDQPDMYEIIAGERRWRAAQSVQLHEVPVVVRDLSDDDALQIALIENIQRQDLNPLEEAEGYRRLAEEFGHSQNEIAEAVGKSRSHVANTLRLLTLPEEVSEMVRSGRLTAGAARAVLNDPDPVGLARRIVDEGLNVRQAEAIRRGVEKAAEGEGGQPASRTGSTAKDADTAALERSLQDALGLKVDVRHKGAKGGEVRISYGSLEQLDEICRRLTRH
ncbi:MAG: ParB/RepB/Spo0J family partition protein [Minwuia sp.]|uniref:ParB/RepB/Spo0J family partition protein n=1 Tax=Minwuia sp. TaxID=2493630 RepID=UPI003A897E5A